MSGPGWDNDVWQQIRDYEQFWTPFDDRFHFRPGMDSATWPAIKEPAGSVTFDLSSVSERAGGFSADEEALNEQVLSAMTAVFSADLPLVALGTQNTTTGTASTLNLTMAGGTAPYTWSATGLPAGTNSTSYTPVLYAATSRRIIGPQCVLL